MPARRGSGDRAAANPPGTAGRRRSAAKGESDLYAAALTEAERVMLSQARDVDGLDEEVALLRVKLATLLRDQPDNTTLLLRSIELLVKAVAARYRLSEKAKDDLYENVLGVLHGIGGAMGLEGFDAAP